MKTTPHPNLRKLTKSDKGRFVSLMGKAFAGDPFFVYLFGDARRDNQAGRKVAAFTAFMFEKSDLLQEDVWGYFEEECLLGAYVADKPQTHALRTVTGGLLLLGRLLPLWYRTSGKTLRLLNAYMRVTRSAVPPWPHHYLIMLGVDPDNQGKGIGKALLNHLFASVHEDASSLGIALDTENRKNVAMYRRFGFHLSKETECDGLPVYCMCHRKEDLRN